MKWYLLLIAATPQFSSAQGLRICRGFVPPSSFTVDTSNLEGHGLSKEQYDQTLDQVDRVMRPEFEFVHLQLEIHRLWNDPEQNTYAVSYGQRRILEMKGGYARHPLMTSDGLILVACHEIGHHLGGAPHFTKHDLTWASAEGEADYYAATKCARKVFASLDTNSWVKNHALDATAVERCESAFIVPDDQNVCIRTAMAGLTMGRVFDHYYHQKYEMPFPALNSPSSWIVTKTFEAHPSSQCRVDTYFQAALCPRLYSDLFSDRNPLDGACSASNGDREGSRPLCWYHPN